MNWNLDDDKQSIAHVTKMALAEVCGINSLVNNNFNYAKEKNKFSGEIEAYTGNFTNNLQLSMPPFTNVSA